MLPNNICMFQILQYPDKSYSPDLGCVYCTCLVDLIKNTFTLIVHLFNIRSHHINNVELQYSIRQ